MGYIQNNLMPEEKIQYSARVHPAVFIRAVILLIISIGMFIAGFTTANQGTETARTMSAFIQLFALIVFLLSISAALEALIVITTTEFAVTNRRVIAKTGFIRRHTLEMLVQKIESVKVNQSVMGRILNFGNVTVTGTGGTRETFQAILDPIVVRKKINQIIENVTQPPQSGS
jgi:uncharacterized membrane protein YdbT with pleckstrin-like domain